MWHLEESHNAPLEVPWPDRPVAAAALASLGGLRMIEAAHHHLFFTHFGLALDAQWAVGAQFLLGAGGLALAAIIGRQRVCDVPLRVQAVAEVCGALGLALTCEWRHCLWPLVALAATCHNIVDERDPSRRASHRLEHRKQETP
jgi:hypothetical protein